MYREFTSKFMCTQLFSMFLDNYVVELAQEQELTSQMADQVTVKIQKMQEKREEIARKIHNLQLELQEYDDQIEALRETQKALAPKKPVSSSTSLTSANNTASILKKKIFSSASLPSILNTKKEWIQS